MQEKHNRARRGMTMVESTVSIVIVGVMVVAALNTLAGSVHGRQLRKRSNQAKLLAFDLMSEVLAAYYDEPAIQVNQSLSIVGEIETVIIESTTKSPDQFGPELGEADGTRVNFDDIDDYAGYVDDPISLKNGTEITGYTGWQRQVTVGYADPSTGQPTGNMTDTGLRIIVVQVQDPQGHQVQTTALRSSASGFSQLPAVQQDLVGWVGFELKLNGADVSVHAGSSSVNQSSY